MLNLKIILDFLLIYKYCVITFLRLLILIFLLFLIYYIHNSSRLFFIYFLLLVELHPDSYMTDRVYKYFPLAVCPDL